jgi:endonuclease/exonuclease/phosphatase family metal-dependent hydrolase
MTAASLKIGSWNILGRRVHPTGKAAEPGAVRSILMAHPVDVLCLQEVHFYREEPDEQLVAELGEVGLTHFVGLPLSESHLDPSARLGVGLASRHPISQRDRFVLDRPHLTASVRGERWVLHDKGMVGCALETFSAQPLWVYSLHLFPFFEFGVGEADSHVDRMWHEFWDYADGLVGRGQLVLAGDFNQQSRRHAARRWSKQNWHFCFERVGTTANGLALDEIVLNWPAAEPKTALVPTFSDHYLVTADVQLQNARSQAGARS